jgi:hypothetical protein
LIGRGALAQSGRWTVVVSTSDSSDTTAYGFNATYTNYGGEAEDFELEALIDAYRDPTGDSAYSDWGWVADRETADGTHYWDNNPQTLQPHPNDGSTKTYTADGITLDEPGIYRTRAKPRVATGENDSTLNSYENNSFTDPEYVKVLEITDPATNITDTNKDFPAKSGVVDQHAGGDFELWDGGYIKLNGDSVDNVGIHNTAWGGAPSYNGGYTDCPGGATCYTNAGYNDDAGSDNPIVHRFTSAGTHTVTYTAADYPEYGAGAPVNSTGTPNTDTTSVTVNVQRDDNSPSVSASHDDTLNPDGSPDSSTTWHSNSGTNYDGIIECFSGSASDTEIGIEATDWNGISASGDSGTCESWSSTGSYSVSYDAWDFANNHGQSSSYTINVKHDGTPPRGSNMAVFVNTQSDNKPAACSNPWCGWHANPSADGFGVGSTSFTASIGDGETGLINCDDGGAYNWSGDFGANGEPGSCEGQFVTYYTSAGSPYARVDATDYHGNTGFVGDNAELHHDSGDPYWENNDGNNDFRYGTTNKRCIGSDDDETGKWKVEGQTCANAQQENCESGDSYTEDTVTPTVYDYHGNQQEGKLTVYEECEGDDGGSGGGGGGGGEIQSIAAPLPR